MNFDNIEISLSKRLHHKTYLITVKQCDKELWRDFSITEFSVACKVYEALTSYTKRLESIEVENLKNEEIFEK